jgi:hypothetical protein
VTSKRKIHADNESVHEDSLSDILRRASEPDAFSGQPSSEVTSDVPSEGLPQGISEIARPVEGDAGTVSVLIERVEGITVAEIDGLMAEMQSIRALIVEEGDRVRRELAGYAKVNRSLLETTQSITDELVAWRTPLKAA